MAIPRRPPRANWATSAFEFPPGLRKAMYTTSAIESANSASRTFPRDRKQYPSAGSAVKLIHSAIGEAPREWATPIVGREQALNPRAILPEGRRPLNLTK